MSTVVRYNIPPPLTSLDPTPAYTTVIHPFAPKAIRLKAMFLEKWDGKGTSADADANIPYMCCVHCVSFTSTSLRRWRREEKKRPFLASWLAVVNLDLFSSIYPWCGEGGRVCLSSLKHALYGGEEELWLDERQCLVVQKQTHDGDGETSVPFSFFGGSNGHCICSFPGDVTQLGHGQCVSGGAPSVLFVSASGCGCWLSI